MKISGRPQAIWVRGAASYETRCEHSYNEMCERDHLHANAGPCWAKAEWVVADEPLCSQHAPFEIAQHCYSSKLIAGMQNIEVLRALLQRDVRAG